MDNIAMIVQLEPPLKQRLAALARADRRTPEDEALCLIENAIRLFEWGMGKGPDTQ